MSVKRRPRDMSVEFVTNRQTGDEYALTRNHVKHNLARREKLQAARKFARDLNLPPGACRQLFRDYVPGRYKPIFPETSKDTLLHIYREILRRKVLVAEVRGNSRIDAFRRGMQKAQEYIRSTRVYLKEERTHNSRALGALPRKYRDNIDVHDAVAEMLRMKGFVHTVPGTFLRIRDAAKWGQIFGSVSPAETGSVGVEIECYVKCSRLELAQKLIEYAGRVTVVHDGSLNSSPGDGYRGLEVRVCDHQSRIGETLEGVCAVLASEGVRAKVNKSCGLHVHLDMRGREAVKCYKRLVRCQARLFDLVPASRRDNNYCARSRTIPNYSDRYRAINAASMRRHGTLEVRLHSGSVNANKIGLWVRLLVKIVECAAIDTRQRSFATFRTFFDTIDLPNPERIFWLERAQAFATPTAPNAVPAADDESADEYISDEAA